MKFILASVFALMASPVIAQGCRPAPTENVHQFLTERYGEAPIGRGTAGEGQNLVMIELWWNPETGTWTLVATRADGKRCPIAAGENWRPVEYHQIGEAG